MIIAMVAALAVIAMMAALGVVLALAMAREDGAEAAAQRAAAGDAEPRVPGWTLLRRALGRRCPRCGRGAVFASYFRMNSRCAEIAIISTCVMVSLFATFPWSRSFWTVFLYLAGAMGERPARAQDSPNATPQAAVPPNPPN